MASHYLDSRPETVTDVFSRDLTPVLTVVPGDRVVVHSLDAHGTARHGFAAGRRL